MKQATTIWTIDDDSIYQIIISKTIKSSKLFASQQNFTKAKNALKLLKNNFNQSDLLPDIILLDINMPSMDGWEFLDEIRAINHNLIKKTQIYIASSSISNEDQKKSKGYPEIVGFLCKPITIDVLTHICSKETNVLFRPNFVQYK